MSKNPLFSDCLYCEFYDPDLGCCADDLVYPFYAPCDDDSYYHLPISED